MTLQPISACEPINLAERERGRRLALEVAADEAIVGDAELHAHRARRLDEDGAVFLDEREDAEDPAHPEFAIAAVNRVAEGANVVTRPCRTSQERQRRGRRARRPILRVDGVVLPALLLVVAGHCMRGLPAGGAGDGIG